MSGGVAIVTLIKGDLVHLRAVVVHHFQHECIFLARFVLVGELREAFIEQDALRC